MGAYAKLIVAILGAGTTAALGIVTPDTLAYGLLTVLSAMLTAYGVYAVPNTPMDGDLPGRHELTE